MKKDELLKYKSILQEIELLKTQLGKVSKETTMDKVKGSSNEYPYCARSFTLEGYDEETYNYKVSKYRKRIENKMNELIEEKDKLLEYIYNIDDSCLRQIMIYRYIEGSTWNEIGEKMNYATSTIRLKHDTFLKISTF